MTKHLAWAAAGLLTVASLALGQNAPTSRTAPSSAASGVAPANSSDLPVPPPLPTFSAATQPTREVRAAASAPASASPRAAKAAAAAPPASGTATLTPATPPAGTPASLPPPLPTMSATTKPVAAAHQPPLQAAPAPATGPFTQPPTTEESENSEPAPGSNQLKEVVVTADLNRTRDQIAPSLGAVAYTIGPSQIQSIPGGENASFQQVLLRAPGVVQDSFGQEHVRGEHGNLTYRVNGVLLPEGLNGFSQELDTRLVGAVTLIDGSLPAEFGFRTAGIVDVTTKTGQSLNANQVSIYGGSYDSIEPSIELGGTRGKLDYFITASEKYNGIGIENPTSSVWPIHDYTSQQKLFGYFSYHIDDTSRLSLLLNGSYADFQLPNTPGLPPQFDLAGHPTADSAEDDERQNEQDYYSVVSYQKTLDKLAFQLSAFSRFGQIKFTPDPVNDLVFQGVSSAITNSFFTNGVQFDSSYVYNDEHTFRGGFLGYYTVEGLSTNSSVFPVNSSGAQTSDVPTSIADDRGNWGLNAGFYLQDEWKLTKDLTLNYGARYDRFHAAFEDADQISPRVNLVWKANKLTTFHAGYSRYFAPPSVQYVWPQTLAKFTGTSNQPENYGDNPTPVERSNYYDIGVTRQVTAPWAVTLDGFYKGAKDLNDLGQFGNALILSPYSYRRGDVYGGELSSTFRQGGLSLFGNFAYVDTNATDINSSQYQFGNDELAYIANHYIKLDHESQYTASAGVSYQWKDNRVYTDMLFSSGLRAGFANLEKVPHDIPVNCGFEHIFHPDINGVKDMKFRFDIVNVFDEVYQIRTGSGIGVAASQYGQRRSFLAGLSVDF